MKRLEIWSKWISSLDVLAIIAHLQFTLNLGPVSLRAIHKQVKDMLCEKLPQAFSVPEAEERVTEVLEELVKQGYLGYSLIEPPGESALES